MDLGEEKQFTQVPDKAWTTTQAIKYGIKVLFAGAGLYTLFKSRMGTTESYDKTVNSTSKKAEYQHSDLIVIPFVVLTLECVIFTLLIATIYFNIVFRSSVCILLNLVLSNKMEFL